jgi:LPXTG-motif cell wall-anchored protein
MGSIIEANFVGSEGLARNPGVQFRAVQPPDLPSTGRRDTTRNSALGGGLGLAVGAVVALVNRRRRTAA